MKLPIHDAMPALLQAWRQQATVVLEAPPGAGKTTCVPDELLRHSDGEVLVLEPRRLAARMAARYVARMRGEEPGQTVGWQVRFENVGGPKTRLRFLTEGVLTRRMFRDPELRGVHTVVLDEFHERNAEGDIALALLRRLQATTRPDLKLLLMSATLDAARLGEALSAPVVRSEGRLFPLQVRYTPPSSRTLELQIADAASQLLQSGPPGDILIFLPGLAEIRRAMRECESLRARFGCELHGLHGDLSAEEQDAAVRPGAVRKLIFATNIAESSVTIEGVRAVIDSGLVRVASDSPWTGMPRLTVQKAERASCEQRAGRAGRLGPGIVVRLYSEEDLRRRASQSTPELLRRELASHHLHLLALRVGEPAVLPWLDAPLAQQWERSTTQLSELGFLREGLLTREGMHAAQSSLPPRLARVAGDSIGAETRLALALLGSDADVEGDLGLALERSLPHSARSLLQRLPEVTKQAPALERAMLTGYADRVARRLREREYQMVGGAVLRIADRMPAPSAEWIIALDVEERAERSQLLLRLYLPFHAECLLDAFADEVVEEKGVAWNREALRAEPLDRMHWRGLSLYESRDGVCDEVKAAQLLQQKVEEAGLFRFVAEDKVQDPFCNAKHQNCITAE
jgi:ATP-dependent helicase HrpB